MEALEKWFVSVEYDHVGEQYSGKVKYENLCYKVVDTTDETPCFHLTPLDCFKQGMQELAGAYEQHQVYAVVHFESRFLGRVAV